MVHDPAPTAPSPTRKTRPKKYQDIYPLNFDNDPEGIYQADPATSCEPWIDHGVTIFRVDNPHTKPMPILAAPASPRSTPSTRGMLFLAEAFTRPAMMRTLGAIGFHQSYTYFAWRTYKQEIERIPPRDLPRRPRTSCVPPSGRPRTTSSPRKCGTAAPPSSRSARCSLRSAPPRGASTRATSSSKTSRVAPSRSPTTTKSTSTVRADGRTPTPSASRGSSRYSTPRAPSTPRCASSTRSASTPPPRIASSRSRARCPESSQRTATPTPSSA